MLAMRRSSLACCLVHLVICEAAGVKTGVGVCGAADGAERMVKARVCTRCTDALELRVHIVRCAPVRGPRHLCCLPLHSTTLRMRFACKDVATVCQLRVCALAVTQGRNVSVQG